MPSIIERLEECIGNMGRTGEAISTAPTFMAYALMATVRHCKECLVDDGRDREDKEDAARMMAQTLRVYRAFVDTLNKNRANIRLPIKTLLYRITEFLKSKTRANLKKLVDEVERVNVVSFMRRGATQVKEYSEKIEDFIPFGHPLSMPQHYRASLDGMAARLAAASSDLSQKDRELRLAREELAASNARISSLEAQLARRSSTVSSVTSTTTQEMLDLRKELSLKDQELVDVQFDFARLSHRFQDAQKEIASLTSNQGVIQADLNATLLDLATPPVIPSSPLMPAPSPAQSPAQSPAPAQGPTVSPGLVASPMVTPVAPTSLLPTDGRDIAVDLHKELAAKDRELMDVRFELAQLTHRFKDAQQDMDTRPTRQALLTTNATFFERIHFMYEDIVCDQKELIAVTEEKNTALLDLEARQDKVIWLEAENHGLRDPENAEMYKNYAANEVEERKKARAGIIRRQGYGIADLKRDLERKEQKCNRVCADAKEAREEADAHRRGTGNAVPVVTQRAAPVVRVKSTQRPSTRKRLSSGSDSNPDAPALKLKKVQLKGGCSDDEGEGKEKDKGQKGDKDQGKPWGPTNVLNQIPVDRREEVDVEMEEEDEGDEDDDQSAPSQLIADTTSDQSRVEDAEHDDFDDSKSVREVRRK